MRSCVSPECPSIVGKLDLGADVRVNIFVRGAVEVKQEAIDEY